MFYKALPVFVTLCDSFARVGSNFNAHGDGKQYRVYYNGYKPDVDIKSPDDPDGMGACKLGVENMAVMVPADGAAVAFARCGGTPVDPRGDDLIQLI